jgi:hypothetical protein
MDPRVGEQVAELGKGLAAEPLGGADALSKHSVGGGGVPPLGGPQGRPGAVSESAAAAGAAVQSAAGALSEAARAATSAGSASAGAGAGGES